MIFYHIELIISGVVERVNLSCLSMLKWDQVSVLRGKPWKPPS